jgi:hypothetical protein
MSNRSTDDVAGSVLVNENGEAIYASDGLSSSSSDKSPMIIPKPPVAPPNDDHDYVIEYASNPESIVQAFEVFSGKVFYPPNNNNNCRGGHKQSKNSQSEGVLEKLARIQLELQELQNECSSTIIDDGEEEETNEYNENEVEIQKVVQSLTNQLQTLQHHHLHQQQQQQGTSLSQQQNLTHVMNQLSIKEREKNSSSENNNNNNNNNPQRSNHGITNEKRLLRIEQYLGDGTGTTSGNQSIMQRLMKAEDKLNSIDEQTLTMAWNKAKIIRYVVFMCVCVCFMCGCIYVLVQSV